MFIYVSAFIKDWTMKLGWDKHRNKSGRFSLADGQTSFRHKVRNCCVLSWDILNGSKFLQASQLARLTNQGLTKF